MRGLDVVGGAGLGGSGRGKRDAHVVGLTSLGAANPHIVGVFIVARRTIRRRDSNWLKHSSQIFESEVMLFFVVDWIF